MTSDPSRDDLLLTNDGLTLPVVDVLTGRGFITGKSGSGKSNTAGVLLEALLEHGHPTVVVDTEGEHYALKERFEILHVGADAACDHVVTADHAEALCALTLDRGIPVILDLSGYDEPEAARRLVERVARGLFERQKTRRRPCLLVVEEVHEFLPQVPAPDACARALIRVAKRGRKRGLGLLGTSQRPADVLKSYVSQCDWLVWHRLAWANDLRVAREVLGKDHAAELAHLETGAALLQADWAEGPVRVQVRRKRTFDAGATPDLTDLAPPDLKAIGDDVVETLREISQASEKRRDELERLTGLTRRQQEEIARLQAELEEARRLGQFAERFSDAMTRHGETAALEVLGEATRESVEIVRRDLGRQIEDLKAQRHALAETVRAWEAYGRRVRRQLGAFAAALGDTPDADGVRVERGGSEWPSGMDFSKPRTSLDEPAEGGTSLETTDRAEANPDGRNGRKKKNAPEHRSVSGDGGALEEPALGPASRIAFATHPAVRTRIEAASAGVSRSYVIGVIEAILQADGPVSYREIAEHLGHHSTGNVSSASTVLERQGVVRKTKQSGGCLTVDLNMAALPQIVEETKRRHQAAAVGAALRARGRNPHSL